MAKQIRYTLEYKIKIVQPYMQGDLSANQLALNLGIHPHTVRRWIQDYNDGKLKIGKPLDNKSCSVSNKISQGQKESVKRPDIGIIISKISVLESEIKDLKAILQKYLLEW